MSRAMEGGVEKRFHEKCLDVYFKQPIFFDILMTGAIAVSLDFLNLRDLIGIKFDVAPESYIETMSTAIITFAGFVLTIITIIVTFKNTLPVENDEPAGGKSDQPGTEKKKSENVVKRKVQLFYNSEYYSKTLSLLMNSVKIMFVLFFLLIACYFINSLNSKVYLYVLFSSLLLTLLTLFRFLLILKIIINFQQENKPNRE